jgi:DNA-binding MarR family transcriptional regulator
MTTHGRGGPSRLVFGSVAEAVLRAAHCPVLLLSVAVDGPRAADAPGAEERELMLRGGGARPPDDARSHPWQRDAVSRGGTTVEDLRWVPVSAARPCPVRGATYGCSVVADMGHVCCRNVPSRHRVDGGGWLPELHQTAATGSRPGSGPPGAQFDVLAQVGAHPGITQQGLADPRLVTKGNVCQLFDRMEAAGLLVRRHEGRTNRVPLTDPGRRVHDEVVPAQEALIAEKMAALDRPGQDRLQELLRKLDRALT